MSISINLFIRIDPEVFGYVLMKCRYRHIKIHAILLSIICIATFKHFNYPVIS